MVVLQLGLFAVLATGVALTQVPGPLAFTSSNPITNDFQPPQPQGYLGASLTTVDYFQWTEDANHTLSGTFQVAYVDNNYTLQSANVPLSGTLDGSNITLSFTLGLSRLSYSGTVSGDTLTLTVPDSSGCLSTATFGRATVEQYNTEVNALRQRLAAGLGPSESSSTCNTTG
jgi:hypothetical protein